MRAPPFRPPLFAQAATEYRNEAQRRPPSLPTSWQDEAPRESYRSEEPKRFAAQADAGEPIPLRREIPPGEPFPIDALGAGAWRRGGAIVDKVQCAPTGWRLRPSLRLRLSHASALST